MSNKINYFEYLAVFLCITTLPNFSPLSLSPKDKLCIWFCALLLFQFALANSAEAIRHVSTVWFNTKSISTIISSSPLPWRTMQERPWRISVQARPREGARAPPERRGPQEPPRAPRSECIKQSLIWSKSITD